MAFIVFEGIDGSGKSALADAVYWKIVLRYGGLASVILTREPNGAGLRDILAKHGGELDKSALATLFAADRIVHTYQIINPWLEQGGMVLCDRYLMSSLAYQSSGSIEDNYRIFWQNSKARIPDMTFLLDMPASEAVKRTSKRNNGKADLFDDMGVSEQERIRKQYLALVPWLAGQYDNIIKLDATKPLEELTEIVLQHLVDAGYLPKEGGDMVND